MVSYEVSIGFVIITVILLAGSMNLPTIVEQQAGGFWNWNFLGGGGLENLPLIVIMIPMMVMFFISVLAETNRPPFDLPEAESELVAGYGGILLDAVPAVHDRPSMSNIVLMCAPDDGAVLRRLAAAVPDLACTDGWPPTLVQLLCFLWSSS